MSKTFQITHPFHPLFGREFELVQLRHGAFEESVFFSDDDGHLKALPARWTSIVPPDPHEVISQGRSLFRVRDLLELVQIVKRLKGKRNRKAGKKQISGV